jgi:hypothetical protein
MRLLPMSQTHHDGACLTIRSSRPRIVASAMCFTLRLHMSAAPLRGGLTQALGAMRKSYIVSILFLALAVKTLNAQELLLQSPDPKITSIVGGGNWQTDDMQGTYRVVLWAEGYEHVSSGVIAEWIVDPKGENEPARVVNSKILIAPSLYYIQKASLLRTKNGYTVVVSGVSTYRSTERISCKIELLPNLTTRTIKPCG